MNVSKGWFVPFALLPIGLAAVAASGPARLQWNPKGAAQYLDARQEWWQSWPSARRDHETVCVSCHTAVPYALSRPLLRQETGETRPSAAEQKMLASVEKRVTFWDQTQPFYKDSAASPHRGADSRGTEAVLNSLILASYDSSSGKLSANTKKAFAEVWDLQIGQGEDAGAWRWLDFGNGPWEAKESLYHGAALEALALGIAPENYKDRPDIKANVASLIAYLRDKYATQPMVNQVLLLWASAKLPRLMTRPEQTQLARAVLAKQQADGGWSLTSLGSWTREDDTPLETRSDGYATGLVVLALEQTGQDRGHPEVARGVAWLASNQLKTTGAWEAFSVNRQRDRKTDIGRFMDDAATGYAVLALANSRQKLVAVDAPVDSPQKVLYPPAKPAASDTGRVLLTRSTPSSPTLSLSMSGSKSRLDPIALRCGR
jgi:hypothetical protein